MYSKEYYKIRDKLEQEPNWKKECINETINSAHGKKLKLDYSDTCSHDDDNDEKCWECCNFVFPIGCMKGEE